MEIKEYQDKVIEVLCRDYFPIEDDWLIGMHSVTKNNNTRLNAITIRKSHSAVSATHYIDEFYNAGYTEEAAAQRIYEVYCSKSMEHDKYMKMKVEDLTDFNKVKNKICYKLINAEMNQPFLQNAPSISLAKDLVLSFYIQYDKDSIIAIDDRLTQIWGIPKDIVVQQLYEIAEANITNIHPAKLCSMLDIMKEYLPPDVCDDMKENVNLPLYVLSNEEKFLGATAIAYGRGSLLKECKERIEKELGSNIGGLYILPSSLHEVILVPAKNDISVQDLHSMVVEINQNVVGPENVLSNEIFYFDEEEGLQQLTFNIKQLSR